MKSKETTQYLPFAIKYHQHFLSQNFLYVAFSYNYLANLQAKMNKLSHNIEYVQAFLHMKIATICKKRLVFSYDVPGLNNLTVRRKALFSWIISTIFHEQPIRSKKII